MSNIRKILGENIKHYRKKVNLSQEELAYRAGLHRTYIGGVERGERNPTIDIITKIAYALGIETFILLRRRKDETESEIS